MKTKFILTLSMLSLGIVTSTEVNAQAKSVTIPKVLRGNWVNNIGYTNKSDYTYYYVHISKHSVTRSAFQCDDYPEKVVAVKRISHSERENSYIYRLKAMDITMVHVKKHTYHYLYLRRITIHGKYFLSCAGSFKHIDSIGCMYGTAKDNGFNNDF